MEVDAMGLYGVSIFAILISAVVSMILGSIWYGALFGKQWIKMMGWSQKDIKKAQADKKTMHRSYALGLLSSLVTAFVLGILVGMTGLYGGWNGACLGAIVWLGFVGTTSISSVIWEGKSVRLWTLNNAYSLLNLMIVGAIMATWG